MNNKLKTLVDKFKTEQKSLTEWTKTRPKTPLTNRIQKWVAISITLIWVILGLILNPISSSASEVRVTPTDLTGYTVTVPSGWTSSAGLGWFDIEGTVNDPDPLYFDNLGIGYSFSADMFQVITSADAFSFYVSEFITQEFHPTHSITFTVTGGDDVDDTSLLQWLVDNDATFISSTPSNPTFSAGFYSINPLWYNTSITTQLDGMTFKTLSGDEYFALTVQNNQLVLDDTNGDTHIVASYDGSTVTWADNSAQYLWFFNDENIPSSLTDLIPSLLIYHPNLTLSQFEYLENSWYYGVSDGFIEGTVQGFNEGYNEGYSSGEIAGYNRGYSEGFDDGSLIGEDYDGNFWTYIFNKIIEALDVNLFGYFSIWDIFTTICGFFVGIWLLKVIAGG